MFIIFGALSYGIICYTSRTDLGQQTPLRQPAGFCKQNSAVNRRIFLRAHQASGCPAGLLASRQDCSSTRHRGAPPLLLPVNYQQLTPSDKQHVCIHPAPLGTECIQAQDSQALLRIHKLFRVCDWGALLDRPACFSPAMAAVVTVIFKRFCTQPVHACQS